MDRALQRRTSVEVQILDAVRENEAAHVASRAPLGKVDRLDAAKVFVESDPVPVLQNGEAGAVSPPRTLHLQLGH